MSNLALILTIGLPGTGKSYFADRLAKSIDADILRSDEIRKELSGLEKFSHAYDDFGSGLYTREMTKRTYNEMYTRAMRVLRKKSCILDATFSRRDERMEAMSIADELNLSFIIIECTTPEHIVRDRMVGRFKDKEAISDATFEIYEKMKSIFEPLQDDEPHITINTSDDTKENLKLVLQVLGGYKN